MMSRKKLVYVVIAVLLALIAVSGASGMSGSLAPEGGLANYYNLLGYEGIGTLGSNLVTNGQTPPVGDYVTTHCRYINVINTTVGQYYLRYPLDLPSGANITNVSFFLADFNPSGVLWVYLRSRPWNSRDFGSTLGLTLTGNAVNSDVTVNISGLNVEVNNQTTEYWIDVSPTNGTSPGQLCVYGIQVTYGIDGAFLPVIQH